MALNLENRLIAFSSLALAVCDQIKHTESGKHLRSQLIRSSTSVALNFGEARSSESPKDLHHKFSIILKELRESYINMKLLKTNSLCHDSVLLEKALNENNQLIAIFVKSIQTVRVKINKQIKR
jgi:four helix bundle protein